MDNNSSPVCRTAKDLNHANTIICCWCVTRLEKMIQDRTLEKIMRMGSTKNKRAFAPSDDVDDLHEHLKRFNFDLELSDYSSDTPSESSDVKDKKYGRYTQRAIRMFGAHPLNQVNYTKDGKDLNGSVLTAEVAKLIQLWCRENRKSEKEYKKALEVYKSQGYVLHTERVTLKEPSGKVRIIAAAVDAFGNDRNEKPKQTALHHHVKQLQEDLEKVIDPLAKDPSIWYTCLNAHCETSYTYSPTGDTSDKHGQGRRPKGHTSTITSSRVKLFQMQARRPLRMILSGAKPTFETTGFTAYAGPTDGIVITDMVKELQLWISSNYKVFGFRPISVPKLEIGRAALFQAHLVELWENARTEVERLGGFLPDTCSDCPRVLGAGATSAGAKLASLHKLGRAIDFDFGVCWEPPAAPNPATPLPDKYVQLKEDNVVLKAGEAPGTAWRLFAFANTQDHDANLAKSSEHLQQWGVDTPKGVLQAWHHDPAHAHGGSTVDVIGGWYVDVTGVLGKFGFTRIHPRGHDWQTRPLDDKLREYWHYQCTNGVGDKWGDQARVVGYTEDFLRSSGYGKDVMDSKPR